MTEIYIGFQQNNIVIATPIREFGILMPRLAFETWDDFCEFYRGLTFFYESERPKVPTIFEEAFKEKANGESNP